MAAAVTDGVTELPGDGGRDGRCRSRTTGITGESGDVPRRRARERRGETFSPPQGIHVSEPLTLASPDGETQTAFVRRRSED